MKIEKGKFQNASFGMVEFGGFLRIFIFGVVYLFLLPGSPAAKSDQPTVTAGARSIAMGGAFTAIADDANTILLNPSGLPLLQRQELSFSYAKRFDLIQNSYTGYVLPILDDHAIGFDLRRDSFSDSELGFSESVLNLSYGYRVHPKFNIGVGVKRVSQSFELDKNSLRSASGLGLTRACCFHRIADFGSAWCSRTSAGRRSGKTSVRTRSRRP